MDISKVPSIYVGSAKYGGRKNSLNIRYYSLLLIKPYDIRLIPHCGFSQGMENENDLCLLEEWDTQENLRSHLKSDCFRILRGAMTLLKEPSEMIFHTVFHPVDIGKI
jgi:hypothetical protein